MVGDQAISQTLVSGEGRDLQTEGHRQPYVVR